MKNILLILLAILISFAFTSCRDFLNLGNEQEKELLFDEQGSFIEAYSEEDDDEDDDADEISAEVVPQSVKDALFNLYPNAEVLQWEMEGSDYEAEINNNGSEMDVILSSTGTLIQTEVDISTESLPQAAKDYIESNYKKWELDEAEKIEKSDGIYYMAEIEK